MPATGLPSSQVADSCCQEVGTLSATEYPEPGTRSLKVCVLENVGSASSSSEKLEGDRPPPVVKEKSCGSFGTASLTTTILPRLRLVNVQVTISPGVTSMSETGLPSSQVAPVWSHPLGTVSASE